MPVIPKTSVEPVGRRMPMPLPVMPAPPAVVLLWIFMLMKPLLFRVTPKIPLPSVLVTSLLVTLNFDWGLAAVEPLGPVSFWNPMPLEPALTVSPMPLITLLFTRAERARAAEEYGYAET